MPGVSYSLVFGSNGNVTLLFLNWIGVIRLGEETVDPKNKIVINYDRWLGGVEDSHELYYERGNSSS